MPSLDALLSADAGIDVAGVVTNPDKPSGRGMKLAPSPVKVAALEAGLEVHQPATARDPVLPWLLKELEADAAVVVAYGKILPGELLAVPPLGFVNLHFSLLPAYRGAAPVQRAVMDGQPETGVSIMVLTEGMDEGPVLAAAREEIHAEDTAGSLGERLAASGARLLVPTLLAYSSGELSAVEQDHDAATYAPKIADDEARIDWTRPARAIHDQARGLNPAPGAWTTWRDARLKVHRTSVTDATPLGPGSLDLRDGKLLAGTGEGTLELVEVQPATKKRMSGADFARGSRVEPGGALT